MDIVECPNLDIVECPKYKRPLKTNEIGDAFCGCAVGLLGHWFWRVRQCAVVDGKLRSEERGRERRCGMNLESVHLRRHGRIKEPSETIKPWLGNEDTLSVAVGIISHDDSVECILIRKCDDPNEADHGRHWRRKSIGLWRYSDGRVHFMDGTVPDIEMQDRIMRCVSREVEACAYKKQKGGGG